MKFGKYEFDLNKDDLILDNGSCYQITTRLIKDGWNSRSPVISKTQFNKLLKDKIIYTNDNLKEMARGQYGNYCTYYKFDPK